MSVKAVLFDMDGIMIDSEPIHSKAFAQIIKEYGYEPVYNEYGLVQTSGLRTKANWELLKQKHGIEEDLDVLTAKKRDYYWKILEEEIKPMTGLINLLKLLKDKDVRLGVVSNSNLQMLELILEKLGVKDYFDIIISGDFVEKGKPHPEIYLTAARQLGIDPRDCIGIEDSYAGVESASGAGMKVIVIPTPTTKGEDISKASLRMDSLEDINWDILSKL